MSQQTEISRLFEIVRKPHHTYATIQTLEALLNNGTPLDCVDQLGQTCLHVAAQYNKLKVIDVILKHVRTCPISQYKHIVNEADRNGYTPLGYAIRNQNLNSVRKLIEGGASVGYTETLQLIQVDANADLTNFLLKHTEVDICNDKKDTPLMYFVRCGNLQAVQKLIGLNADVNRFNCNGVSVLGTATERSVPDIIKLLIEEGAIVNPMNGKLPLVCAVENNNLENVKTLVSYGANINKIDSSGNSPLLAAVRRDNNKIIEWLLDNGAHYSIHSVFLDAIKIADLKIIEMLIEKGAKVNMQYKNGSTPLLTAIEAKRLDVIETLLTHGADINLEGNSCRNPVLPFRSLLETNLVGPKFNKIMKKFIDSGADVNITASNGFTWLAKYAQLDDYQMVQYLVTKGANINLITIPKNAPLVIAARNSNFQMFNYFVESGGDIELVREELDKVANSSDGFAVFFEELSKEPKKKRIKKEVSEAEPLQSRQ